jgi:hypothetical protein
LTPSAVLSRPDPGDRSERLSEWSSSGRLTYGEAEMLLALDESNDWRQT